MPRPIISSLFITIISVTLCIQLVLLPSRTGLSPYSGNDHPRIKLPTASNGQKICCFDHKTPTLSLNRHGQWVTHGEKAMNDQQVQAYLHAVAKKDRNKGLSPILRLRIPAKTPAKRFIRLTHIAEEAGMNGIFLAVWQSKPYE